MYIAGILPLFGFYLRGFCFDWFLFHVEQFCITGAIGSDVSGLPGKKPSLKSFGFYLLFGGDAHIIQRFVSGNVSRGTIEQVSGWRQSWGARAEVLECVGAVN
jgi:hypothetical protein